jgi:thiol reductant ABC exporter CydD subunit
MRPIDPRLLREAPAARRFLVVAGLLGLVSAAAIVAQAVALGLFVAGVFLDGKPVSDLKPELAALVAATIVRSLVAWALESGGRVTALEVATRLRAKLLAHLLAARPAGVDGMPAGEVAAAAVTGLEALDPYFARFLPQLVLSLVVPVVIFVWVALHDVTSAVVMALTLPLIPLFGALIGKTTEARTLRRFGTLSILSAYFLDVVRGLPTLRAFGRGRIQTDTIERVSDAYRRETMGTLRIAFLSALVLELAATLSTAVIAVEIGVRLVDGGIALAPAFAVLVLAPEYYGPLRAAAAQFHASTDGLAAAGRVFELLDLPPAVTAPEHPLPAPGLQGAEIRLEELALQHPGRDEPAFAGVSAVLGPGERIALAGPSGAGKTSLLSVLLRLVDPTEGRIVAGGVDLALVDPAAWRARVAWLPQRPRLAGRTLRDALAAGASLTDAELWEAVEQAGALPVLNALPDGLNTVLGERAPFSAGEIRRLALARALAPRKPVLLLDEPTTHLDAASAAVVAEAISALPRDGIVVFATHDERLLRVADRIVALEARMPELEAVA